MGFIKRTGLLVARMGFVLCIPLLVFSLVVAVAFNSMQVYEYGFDTYEVSADTGFAETELTRAARELIDYFNSSEEPLDITVQISGDSFSLFTREEALHMKDVKGLVRLDYGVLAFTGSYAAVYAVLCLRRRDLRRPFARSVLAGSVVMAALMVAVGLAAMQDFNNLFIGFHLLAFTNDFWSAEGYMLRLFPGGFWFDVFRFCAFAMIVVTAALGGAVAWWLNITGKGLQFRRLLS